VRGCSRLFVSIALRKLAPRRHSAFIDIPPHIRLLRQLAPGRRARVGRSFPRGPSRRVSQSVGRPPTLRARSHASDPYRLGPRSAQTVVRVIEKVCANRDWQLLAAHVRSTHVHCVVSGIVFPNRAIADLKAYASRELNLQEGHRKRWVRGGSTRPLPSEEAITAAVRYVIDGQGEPMAVYDASCEIPES
jgi:hypothetical protein